MNDGLGEQSVLRQRLLVVLQYLTVEDELDKLGFQFGVELSPGRRTARWTTEWYKWSTYLLKLPTVSCKYPLTVLISSFKYFNLIAILSSSLCWLLSSAAADVDGCDSTDDDC